MHGAEVRQMGSRWCSPSIFEPARAHCTGSQSAGRCAVGKQGARHPGRALAFPPPSSCHCHKPPCRPSLPTPVSSHLSQGLHPSDHNEQFALIREWKLQFNSFQGHFEKGDASTSYSVSSTVLVKVNRYPICICKLQTLVLRKWNN